MKNKFLKFGLIVAVITILAVSLYTVASATTISGSFGADGDNVTYTLNTETGVLNITGTGDMGVYSFPSEVPWSSYKSYVKTVKISVGITSIGDYAFYYCSSLTSIEIPDSVTSIGDRAFFYCSSLTSIEIPDSVTSIGSDAFSNCSSLTSIEIPDSVTSIGSSVFYNTAYYNNASNWENGDILYIGNHLIEAKKLISGNYSIKEGTLTIADDAFSNCSSLTSIEIPDSVTSISSSAFSGCSRLTCIEIHDSVTSIGEAAFYNCSSLTSVEIPDSVTSIGYGAFNNTPYYNNASNWENGDILYIGNHLIEAKKSISGSYSIKEGTLTIAYSAFSNCSSLISIEIPDSVTSIGSSVFYYCSRLTSIVIPDSVTSIGGSAFHGCNSLTSIEIPDSVTSIGNYAFYGCRSLTSIEIPDNVTSIGYRAFEDCRSLTSVTFESKDVSISSSAFNYCDKLTTIYLYKNSTADEYFSADEYTKIYLDEYSPESDFEYSINDDGISVTITGYLGAGGDVLIPPTIAGYAVTSIGDSAFYNCSSLTSIEIPDSVTSVGYSAFRGCSSLTSVEIPNSVTSIGNYAFSGCSSLTTINVEEDNPAYCDIDGVLFRKDKKALITYPGGGATTYTIPDSVTNIGVGAFYNCSSLTSVEIPDSVTWIGSYAFSSCSSLTTINVEEGNPTYCDIDGVLFSKDKKTLVAYPGGGATVYLIPDSVTSIGYGAFRNCSNLTSIEIPDSVTSIGASAFEECSNLTSIEIPDSVTSIGGLAFYGCRSLTSVTFESKDVSIGNYAFNYCDNLTTIYLYRNSTADEYFSADEYTKIYLDEYSPESDFEYSINDDGISVTITGYLGAGGDVLIPPTIAGYTVTSIGNRAFEDCYTLTSVAIPRGVTYVGFMAFYYCSGLTSISIPDGVTSIGNSAFQCCTNLTSIEIPGSVTSIGDSVFSGCDSLAAIEVDASNAKYCDVDGVLFSKNEKTIFAYPGGGASTYTIPDGVTIIGDAAFANCSSLTSVVIPDSMTSIGNQAFYGCGSLTSIEIPDSVTNIGSSAFRYCSSLESVTFESKDVSIDASAFNYCDKLTTIYLYKNSTADEYFSADEYTKIYLDDPASTPGDINGDGEVNAKDHVLLMQYLATWHVEIDLNAADCNGDGTVSIVDAVMLSQYLAGWDVTLG